MRYLLILLLSVNIYANMTNTLLELYKDGKYKQVCKKGFDYFQKYKRGEKFISIYAFGCLKSDYIDRLVVPIAALKRSKEARANATYFSVILMQKKMLYQALVDNYEIKDLKLPTTNYVLSKVFDMYVQNQETGKKFYIFQDKENKDLKYKLYILKNRKLSKMIIEEYLNNKRIKQHIYW